MDIFAWEKSKSLQPGTFSGLNICQNTFDSLLYKRSGIRISPPRCFPSDIPPRMLPLRESPWMFPPQILPPECFPIRHSLLTVSLETFPQNVSSQIFPWIFPSDSPFDVSSETCPQYVFCQSFHWMFPLRHFLDAFLLDNLLSVLSQTAP